MQIDSIYFIKVIACSGILYLYYRTFLHNKIFHQWNRFYLLLSVLASIIIPLIQVKIFLVSNFLPAPPATSFLTTIVSNNGLHEEEGIGTLKRAFWPSSLFIIYAAGCSVMLVSLLQGLIKIRRLVNRFGFQKCQGFLLVGTNEKISPFSFFNYIFWNNAIDLHSEPGKRILQHEQVHVQQWHSIDKLFINIILIFFWCNPFFWLIRRELSLIHEFIADSKTIPDANAAVFSSMILSAVFPSVQHSITSHFSFSPVKRRLFMLNLLKKNRKNYFSLLLALPVLFGLLAFFSFTYKLDKKVYPASHQYAGSKTYTIIIDAGHGGRDPGVVSENGLSEKDIVLEIAKKIRMQNTNKAIRIELTRTTDVLQPLRDKVNAAVAQKPDAFISLHLNNAEAGNNSFDVYVSRNASAYTKQSQLLGTVLLKEMRDIHKVEPELQKRISKGIWVLDAPTITYPAALINCGNMDNPGDLTFITDPVHQGEIAGQILKGIEAYLASVNLN